MGNCLGKTSSRWGSTIISVKPPIRERDLLASDRTDETASPVTNREDDDDENDVAQSSYCNPSNPACTQERLEGSHDVMLRRQQTPEGPLSPVPQLPCGINFNASCNTRKAWPLEKVYTMGTELGRGAFGAVYSGTHRFASRCPTSTRPEWKTVAIKQTKPNALDLRDVGARGLSTPDELEEHCQEVKALIRLREGSPATSRVLFLHEYFLSKEGPDFFLVTELLGLELDEWRAQCDVFTEKMAIDICRTILQGVEFCASRCVVHRDIKLQNIMFRTNGNFRTLKLVDFGLARVILPEDEAVKDFCGSIGYIAPEIYNRKRYRFEVDMFAFGVLLFRLISGVRPFPSNDDDILKRDTCELRYSVQGSDWEGVSSAAKDLIRKLLINQSERLTAEEALSHPWFSELGASVLRADLSCSQDRPDSIRSKAFLLSSPTSESLSESESPETCGHHEKRFWIDESAEIGLATIMSQNIYSCRLIPTKYTGMICVEEVESPMVCPVATYTVRLWRSYTEADCRTLFRSIAQCLKKLHDAGIAHLNLNMGAVVMDPFGKASLTGLCYAKPIRENQPFTGQPARGFSWYAFKAPEIDNEFVHSEAVDLWSLGVILYVLMTGVSPFRGNGLELVNCKHAALFDFGFVEPSPNVQRLVRGLITVNPSERFTIDDVLNHPWLHDDEDYLKKFKLAATLEGLRYW